MSKLVVLCGVPGSGKSFFSCALKEARKAHTYIASSDSIRELIFDNRKDHTNETLVFSFLHSFVKIYSEDKDALTIFDSTNFSSKRRIIETKEIKPLYDKIFLVYFDIKKEVIVYQNTHRKCPVSEEVLDNFFNIIEKPDEIDYSYFDKVFIIKDHNIKPVIDEILKN